MYSSIIKSLDSDLHFLKYIGNKLVNLYHILIFIQEFSSQAQFIVISHREENIVNAERIYGVSMQQSGITDVFSVDLEEEAKRLLEPEDAKVEES